MRSTVPAVPAGLVTNRVVSPEGNAATLAEPNMTAVAVSKPLPCRMTCVPPPVVPEFGLIPLTMATAGLVYVNLSAGPMGLDPPGPSTTTSTVPAVSAGVVTKISVSPTTKKLEPPPHVAVEAPNFTPVAPVNPEPKMVTAVPPWVAPLLGLTAYTTGAEEAWARSGSPTRTVPATSAAASRSAGARVEPSPLHGRMIDSLA